MARRDGSSTILQGARLICRMVGKYGTSGFASRYEDPTFTAAVAALAAACMAFDAADDYAGLIDQTPPQGPEDEVPAEG